MKNSEEKPDSKIEFRTESEGEVYVETLWATKLSDNTYKLDNSPFYAYNVSWEDIIEAASEGVDSFPVFKRVIKKSGNKTVRIIFDSPLAERNPLDKRMEKLTKLGCTFEGANPKYIALNIPPNVELNKVKKILIESKVEWEHADPSYSQLYSE